MRKVLDLGELHKQLRQTEEHEPHFDEELNPYLLDTVLPQLEGEVHNPRLLLLAGKSF